MALRASAGMAVAMGGALALAFLALPSSLSAQVSGLRGLKDHSQCCAIGMPSLHGAADGSYDPMPDPVLSRRRAPAPPAPNASAGTTPAPDAPVEYPPLKLPTTKVDGHLEVGF
ncbi:MAG TPA: hypothetical protein VGE76_11225, partial [Opitutaceae bacterium]